MKILGIDPGTATIGYGLIETKGSKAVCLDVGAVTTPKNEADSWRLERIYKEITSLIKKLPFGLPWQSLCFTGLPIRPASSLWKRFSFS